jgi:hypothetical protein
MSGPATNPRQADGEPVGEVRFPAEWIGGARFTRVELVAQADVDGGKGLLVMAVLSDGTNLAGVTYPGGQAVLRIAPMGNVVESHFDGARPSAHRKTEAMWGVAVEAMHAALEEVGREA